ncbi:MAG: L,D-transpeptidase family protein [Thermoanaerobaculia bacterium]|nr:L,D-transpeptidase family protein [Thermoanaerobaculia bacterium]
MGRQRVVALIVYLTFVASALAQETRAPLPSGTRADLVVVDKSERSLKLFRAGRELRTYRVALGPNPEGHKLEEGDGRTPEGRYVIDWRNAKSAFHRSLHVSYPNAHDRREARRRGVDPGGAIMIHGLPGGMGGLGAGHVASDWTLGCIAVTSEEIEEIWRVVRDGTPIDITP